MGQTQLQALEMKLQQKVGQLSSEREARETFHDTVKKHLAGDRKMRADHQSELTSKVDAFEQKIQTEVVAIKGQIATEVQARVKHYEAVQEHLNAERRARENHA